MSYLIGVDGGGTRTTVAVADGAGREKLRREGPAGLVDPRVPEASAHTLTALIADVVREAGFHGPAAALCAGLAGVGHEWERRLVEDQLAGSGVADRVRVVTDGYAALEGAFAGGAGILLVAGTGSVAHGRAEDGRTADCGGWGLVLGDEGSGYALARRGLTAVLRAVDGRDPETELRPRLLAALPVDTPRALPTWVARATKAEVAALARIVIHTAADGDTVAAGILDAGSRALAEHASALARRLAPWSGEVPVVLHGGTVAAPAYAARILFSLQAAEEPFVLRTAVSDAAAGALGCARSLIAG